MTGVFPAFLRIHPSGTHFPENLVPDALHDLLEGCCKYSLQSLLKWSRTSYGLSWNEMNEAINEFRKTADRLEKHHSLPLPTFRDNNFTCHQTASQWRILCTRLPFIMKKTRVGAHESFFQSEQYQNFLYLIRMLAIAASPILTPDDINQFQIISEKYLKTTADLYGADAVKNKLHHTMHYAGESSITL